ncbi:MAG: glycosyltransferase family 4 protein, partial [Candidatus Omnitrophota bacterium]
MRIAIIGSRGIPAQYSGVERAVEEISKRLVLRGHDVTVYCRSDKYLKNEYKGIKLVHVFTWHTKNFGTFIHVFLSTLMVVFQKVDIVHYHALGPSFFSFFPRLFGKKIIVTVHCLDWQRKKWGKIARLFLRFCQYPAMYFPHRTIVVSYALKDYFEKKFKKSVYYISNGAGAVTDIENPEILKSEFEKDQYVLCVGRLVPEKGLQYLIKAYNDIHTPLTLVLAGASSFTDNYVASLKQMGGAKVKFVGFVDGLDLALLYTNAYMVVLSSEVEGAPLVLLEAMHYGKCVLSSDLPECREILEMCGVYFKSKDYGDLKDKLQWLLTVPDLVKEYGQKAKERVSQSYDWD